MPIYLLSAVYRVLSADANLEEINSAPGKYAKLLGRLVQLIKKDLPGACYIAILEIVKHFERFNPKYADFELEAKINDSLLGFLETFETLFEGKIRNSENFNF